MLTLELNMLGNAIVATRSTQDQLQLQFQTAASLVWVTRSSSVVQAIDYLFTPAMARNSHHHLPHLRLPHLPRLHLHHRRQFRLRLKAHQLHPQASQQVPVSQAVLAARQAQLQLLRQAHTSQVPLTQSGHGMVARLRPPACELSVVTHMLLTP